VIPTSGDTNARGDWVPPTELPGLATNSARGGIAGAWRGWPGRIARIAFAILPLAWLSLRIDWRTVASRASQVGALGIVLATAATFASVAVGAVRWSVMLRAYGADPERVPRLATLLRHNFVGQYFSVLPTGVAGEAVRAWRVAHCTGGIARSLVVVFVDRIAGLVGLLLVAGGAAIGSSALRGGAVGFAMNVGLAIALALGLFVIALPQLLQRHDRLAGLVRSVPVVGRVVAGIPPASRPAGLLVAIALSAVTQFCVVLTVAALIAPLAPTATLLVCSRVVPAIILVTYVPLTPGGLGQREAAFVALFGLVHVEPAAAVAASLLYFGVFLSASVVGGVVVLWERWRGVETAVAA
jgi:uncharacterized membrane protein YbhN (UPF0104 family)